MSACPVLMTIVGGEPFETGDLEILSIAELDG